MDMRKKLKKYKGEIKDITLLFSCFFVVPAMIGFPLSSNPPRLNGTSPVIVKHDLGRSCGYDFDKDGILDYAQREIGGGRIGWATSYEIERNSLEFRNLQDIYSKQHDTKE